MSLATLARKTKAKQRVRTRGNFILNMTGRGNVLGMNAKMSRGNCGGKLTKCAGKRAACCVGVPNLPPCVELNNQDNTFTVGNAGIFWGFDAGATGNLVPATIDISGVEWMGWQTGGSFPNQFYINFDVSNANMPQNHFDSISFVNCNDKSIRTYRTTDASYNAQDPSGSSWPSTGGQLRPTWRWDASTNIVTPGGGYSGYTIAQENAYWQGVSGETLKMYIDTVPNVEDICCPKAQCCQFKHGGKPAPQMGYGVYLNRKSKGAYHPGGGPQCCTKPNAKSGKIVWKQPANIGAGEIVKNKKDTTLACYHQTNNNSSLGSAQGSSKTCSGKGTYIELYKYKMHVGDSDNGSYGYDGVGGVTFGNLCPATLMGFRINTMEFEDDGGYQFELSLQTNNINNPTQCSIQSITFVDSLDNSVKTYHTKNVTEFDGDGNIVRWLWSGGNPQDYWAGKLHHCLQVTIEVEKQKTYGLNSCTGCATNCDDPNNNFTVGYQSAFDFWGYDNAGGTSAGKLVPNTIDGSGIRYMGYQTTGSFPHQFYINFYSSGGVNTPPQDLFNSITFANCNDNSTRTYYTVDASYNSQDPSGYTGPGAGLPGGLGCPTWRWDASTNIVAPGGGYSGYTRAEEVAYWQGVSGENLQVYIDNPNPNLCCCKCCPVKKNICGCRATDLVRYTRINKSFGCQTTKTLPFNVSAADQIARKRSSALCPKYGISGFKKPQMLGSCSGR